MRLLQAGNTRLGRNCLNMSLPPGKEGSCINCATEFCDEHCYGKRDMHAAKHTKRYDAAMFEISKTADFVPAMISEFQRHRAGLSRIHVRGDFYEAAYAGKWFEIVRALPQFTFLTYTRGWRDLAVLPELEKLLALPNIRVFWSTDCETVANGEVPPFEIAPVAHWCEHQGDPVPFYASIAWNRGQGPKVQHGCYPCAREAATSKSKPTCVSCRRCFSGIKAQTRKRCRLSSSSSALADKLVIPVGIRAGDRGS